MIKTVRSVSIQGHQQPHCHSLRKQKQKTVKWPIIVIYSNYYNYLLLIVEAVRLGKFKCWHHTLFPSLEVSITSAPASNRIIQVSRWPPLAARISAVNPY